MAGNPAGNRITNEIMYMANLLGRGQMPYGGAFQNAVQGLQNYKNRVRGVNTPIQQRPVVNPEFMRPDYSGAGERARRFQEYQTGRNIPGANTNYSARLGGGLAADRAYESEKSRVAQLTAQDPELQRYEDARKLAVAPGATPEQVQSAEDIGMQIWAQKYGKTLAPKVKPGQAGYDVIQRTLYPGGTPVPALPAESEAMLNAIAPANEFGVRPDVTPMPGQLPSFGSATEAMFNAITGGGSLVTPMPQKSLAAVPQEQAQNLADTYKKALLSGLGNDPLGIEGIRRYGQ